MRFDKVSEIDLPQIEALAPEGWDGMRNKFQFYINHPICDPIKLIIGKDIIGVGAAIRFKHTGWLGYIVVRQDHRKQGVGLRIVEELTSNLLAHANHSVSLLSTPMGESVYQRAQFKVISEYIFFKRNQAWNSPKNISKNIVRFHPDLYQDVISLDTLISGEGRENLIKDYLNDGFFYLKNQRLRGFYLPNVGEGCICALDPSAGLALMRLKYQKDDKVAVPTSNLQAISFLKENGFIETGLKQKRMVYGQNFTWKPECIYSRVGGDMG